MARARTGRWVAAATALGIVLAAPGCVPGSTEILVVGRDVNGTPVVGAVDCSVDDRIPAEVVSVSAATGPDAGREIWRVDRPGHGSRPPEIGPPAPAEPEPRFIGGIEMIAIGDPRPPGGDADVALADPLPTQIVVEASIFADDTHPIGEVRLAVGGQPDVYEVVVRNPPVSRSGSLGTDATGTAALVDEECAADDWDFDGGAFLLVAGIAAGALLLLAVPIGVVTARQFRRAGAAVAARRCSGASPGS